MWLFYVYHSYSLFLVFTATYPTVLRLSLFRLVQVLNCLLMAYLNKVKSSNLLIHLKPLKNLTLVGLSIKAGPLCDLGPSVVWSLSRDRPRGLNSGSRSTPRSHEVNFLPISSSISGSILISNSQSVHKTFHIMLTLSSIGPIAYKKD